MKMRKLSRQLRHVKAKLCEPPGTCTSPRCLECSIFMPMAKSCQNDILFLGFGNVLRVAWNAVLWLQAHTYPQTSNKEPVHKLGPCFFFMTREGGPRVSARPCATLSPGRPGMLSCGCKHTNTNRQTANSMCTNFANCSGTMTRERGTRETVCPVPTSLPGGLECGMSGAKVMDIEIQSK